MKRLLLGAAVVGSSVAPALAGGGGGEDTGIGAVLVQAVVQLAYKLVDLL